GCGQTGFGFGESERDSSDAHSSSSRRNGLYGERVSFVCGGCGARGQGQGKLGQAAGGGAITIVGAAFDGDSGGITVGRAGSSAAADGSGGGSGGIAFGGRANCG
ncbi:unnamed protein product, partial [Pylaiella littoralis]